MAGSMDEIFSSYISVKFGASREAGSMRPQAVRQRKEAIATSVDLVMLKLLVPLSGATANEGEVSSRGLKGRTSKSEKVTKGLTRQDPYWLDKSTLESVNLGICTHFVHI